MYSLLLCCALFLLFSATNAKAAGPTYVTGDITTDTTWTEANSPYVVLNNITVNEGVTLTIQSNVTVKVNHVTTIHMDGILNANGAPGLMVNLTKNNTLDMWGGFITGPKSSLNFNYVYFNNATGMTIGNNVFLNNSRFIDVGLNSVWFNIDNANSTITITNNYFRHTGYLSGYVIGGEIDFVSIENETKTYTIPITIENNVFAGGQTLGAVYIDLEVDTAWAAVINMVTPMSFKDNTFENMAGKDAIYVYREVDSYDNSTVTWSGNIAFLGNTFDGTNYAMYVEDNFAAYEEYNAQITVTGDVSCTDNTLKNVNQDGFIRDVEFYTYTKKACSYTGQTIVTGNSFDTNNRDAVNLYWYIYVYKNATCSISGDLLVQHNTFVECSEAIYSDFEMYLYNMWNTTGTFTNKMDLSNNTITNMHGEGVYYYWYADTVGYADAFVYSDLSVRDNTIDDEGDYFVYLQREYYSSDHSTMTIVSPVVIMDNDFRHGNGLLYIQDEWYTYDDAVADILSPYTISGNVAAEFSEYGVYVYYIWGETYDNSKMDVACEFQMTNNVLMTRDESVVYLWRGFEADDDSVLNADMLINIQDNIFESEGSYALELYDEFYAYDDEVGAQLTLVGNYQVWENELRSVDGDAIFYYLETYIDATTYGAKAIMNLSAMNWIFIDNKIMTEGSYIGICWQSMSDNIEAHGGEIEVLFGDIIITDNVVEATGSGVRGILVEFEISVDSYAGSSATVVAGEIIVEDNEVSVTGENCIGIAFTIGNFYAYGDEGNASVAVEKISVSNNVISLSGNNGEAIYASFPTTNHFGAYAYGAHDYQVMVEAELTDGMTFANNDIEVVGIGSVGFDLGHFYVYADSEKYLSNATLVFNVFVLENVIDITDMNAAVTSGPSGNYGMLFEGFLVESQYATSSAMADSNLLVKDNLVKQDGIYGYGIYIEDMDAYTIDESDFIGMAVIITSAVFEENIISGGQYGIYIEDGDFPVQIVNNVVTGTYGAGMYLDTTAADVIENAIFDNFGDGIYLYTSAPVLLDDNIIRDNFGYGLYMTSSEATMYNGLFNENTDHGIYVSTSDVVWYIDEVAEVRSNDVQFSGYIYVQDGGMLIIDLCQFDLDDAYSGITKIMVENGGTADLRNVDMDADGSMPGLFLVEGKLSMLSCSMTDWYELYLGPESDAEISASNFMGEERYGIHIDNASPRIANCLFVACDMAGIFVEGEDANPSIENCVFMLNTRGIYAYQTDLGNAISNIFVGNLAAGIYGEEITGKINANTFLLNKVEIFLVGSSVSVEDNEIGYAHLIDALSAYTPAVSVLVNYAMEVMGMMNFSIPVGSVTAPYPNMYSLVASLLLDHDGIMCYDSTVICQGNTYGLLSWAVYAEDSTIIFSDVVQPNDIHFAWLNSDMVQANLSLPVQAMDGIYARNSQVTISNAIIEVLDTAVFLSSSNANITNSQLLADKFDVYATGDSTVTLSATVLDGKVKADGDAAITASFVLDILTADNDGKAKGGVHVVVKNAQGEIVAQGDSDSNGHFLCTVVAYKLINGNKDSSMNPYTVTVEYKNGAVDQKISVDDAAALTVLAKKDNTALYAGIVVLAVVVLLVAYAVMRRKK